MSRTITAFSLIFLAAFNNIQAAEADKGEVKFERHQFTISRVRGDVLIDGVKVGRELVTNQDQKVSLIEAFDGLKFDSDKAFLDWTRHLRGVRTYTYDDVLTISPDGTVNRTPLVLLPPEKRASAEPRWQAWIDERAHAEQIANTERDQRQLETSNLEQLNQSVQAQTEELIAQTRLLEVASGATDLWEVQLTNRNQQAWGTTSAASLSSIYASNDLCAEGGCVTIQVTARDSKTAVNTALEQYAGYRLISARKLAGR